MDRQRMKRNLCYGLLVAVGLAAIAGGAVVLLGRGSADAAEARLPDGAGIAIDGRAGAAEWAHCLSQRFEESGLLRAAWDPDYVYVLVAEDLPARKAGSDGDMVIARLHVDGHRVYAFFKESWTETGPKLLPFDAATYVEQQSAGVPANGFIGLPVNEAVGSQFRCTTESRIPLEQIGIGGGTVSSISISVMRIHNPSLLPAQDAD